MAERLSNLGYYAVGVESTYGTSVTPSIFLPCYKDTMATTLNLDMLDPIAGVRALNYQAIMGLRSHEGMLTLQAEPNTAEYAFDMLLTKGTITGAGPYTHPFTLGESNSYTMDILRGQVVERYFGVKADAIDVTFNKNEMRLDLGVSAKGAFIVREIASVSTTTITLKTDYDPSPSTGLVVGDLVRLMSATTPTTTLDTTISTINADGITVVLAASAASFAAGDYIFIRPQTVTTNWLQPFQWARTNFNFALTAAAALTATPTNLESGSKYKIDNNFEKKQGADRSGSYDPVALVRTLGNISFTSKRFFDLPDEADRWLKVSGYACVARHYVTSGANTYELRVTMNSLITKSSKRPLETGKIIYQESDFETIYNAVDAQVFSVLILNALSS